MFRIKPSIINNICLKPLLNRMSKNKKFSTSNSKFFTSLTEKQENMVINVHRGMVIIGALFTPAICAKDIINNVKNNNSYLAIEIITHSMFGIIIGFVLPFATPFLIPFGLFWLRVKYLKNNDLNNIVIEEIKKS